ncbi:HIV Tat-specific factor 1 homolog [Cephus cinctus]|uniref:HIV Tat-specific factor 1 homolog n=1 Tax=Cephus cinctus TaxID=211228 RepID=A0AAJ7C4N7_CEPCN|nr:HIV Tat-specific factor 1 homolog [Cephus cinctus]
MSTDIKQVDNTETNEETSTGSKVDCYAPHINTANNIVETKCLSNEDNESLNENMESRKNMNLNKDIQSQAITTQRKRDDDQVEEFDTDEEDEVEHGINNKSNKNINTTAPDYSKHLSYEGDLCIYTEPATGNQLVWDTEKNAWMPRASEVSTKDLEIPNDSTKQYEFDGQHYVYTDKSSNITYKFDQDKNEWIPKDSDKDQIAQVSGPAVAAPGGVYGFENDTHTYTDPNDGSIYIWDREKSAWFPKVDDEFMARYQMSYGFTDPNKEEENVESKEKEGNLEILQKLDKEQRKAEAKRKAQEPPSWFEIDEAHNTAIYVSGLPLDITMEELTQLVTKCGLVARDEKGKDKIKLYRDAGGEPKGDALCTYIKIESVDLALKVLDGWQIRGKTLSVQRAKFQMKGTYDPALKPKRKKKDKERLKKNQEKLFDWRPERMRGEPQKCERVVIIKNLFAPEDFDKEVALLLEYQQDIRSECLKCGDVRKVIIYDRHPEGVAQVTFGEPSEAQACIQLLNGRWFGQRKISAEIWDGKTKYKVAETDAEIEARLAKWDKFLEDEDERKEAAKNAAQSK